jgi:coenzyme F420-reducing hydrogenase beta subunit
VESRFEIARTRAEVLAAQGSKYMPVYFRHAEALIRSFEGKLAAVLLPCDAKALARLRRDEPSIDATMEFVITLFCGHNSERALTDAMVERFSARGDTLTDFRHRFGHWRGNLRLTFANRPPVVRKFAEFSDYQNLFLFAQRKCHACFDHTGFYCDLSAGDVWSQRLKHDPVKHSGVFVRSDRAQSVFDQLVAQGAIAAQRVSVRDICNGQSRSLPFHYNVSARSRVSGIFGMRLKDLTETKVKWNDVIVAFFVMLNERVTRSPTGQRIVLKIPRPILKAYLMFLKGLESI